MDIVERQKLRRNILRLSYNYHFGECFNSNRRTELDLNDDYQKEIFLAAKYLSAKGLIRLSISNGSSDSIMILHSDITANGIDLVENEFGIDEEE